MVARSHRVLAADIKSLPISSLVCLEMSLKCLDFGNFMSSFGIFQAVRFGTSILQTSYFGQIVLSDSQSLRYRSEIFRDYF